MRAKKKKPKPEARIVAVNEANAKYWKRETSAFHERIEKHPGDALAAAELVEELARAGYIKAPKNMITATAGYERARSREQSERAQRPRPEHESGIKKAVIDAIRSARHPDERLGDFIARRPRGITIIPCKTVNQNLPRSQWRYDVSLPGADPWRIARRTLQAIWKDAERAS